MKKLILALVLATAVPVHAQQATRVVCHSPFQGYQTFTGQCPFGWTFVGIAQ